MNSLGNQGIAAGLNSGPAAPQSAFGEFLGGVFSYHKVLVGILLVFGGPVLDSYLCEIHQHHRQRITAFECFNSYISVKYAYNDQGPKSNSILYRHKVTSAKFLYALDIQSFNTELQLHCKWKENFCSIQKGNESFIFGKIVSLNTRLLMYTSCL